MESTGIPNRIHISQETADLITKAGKSNWVAPRADKVVVKGKGEMETFWLVFKDSNSRSETGSMASIESSVNGGLSQEDLNVTSDKEERLIKWMVDVLAKPLKQIKAKRTMMGLDGTKIVLPKLRRASDKTVLDEVKEIVRMPHFDGTTTAPMVGQEEIVSLDPEVEQQLTEYVACVAKTYRNNPFHNFEHASHVTMSVIKLMSRIVAPDLEDQKKMCRAGEVASRLHDHTYGITSDPLTHFACAFSALIHDADHSGVPNSQVIKEKPWFAEYYNGRSVAEQHSVDLSWNLLMEDRFEALRQAIYHDEESQIRFRELVVNSVMATDIMDKELKSLRNNRWDKAFKMNNVDENEKDTTDRKATIVIEHLIQASDVAHTMQHWHVYRKWNERLFREMYNAFKDGRSTKNPADFWFEGEKGFFDFYIIPLAQKLKDCGVFGVSSDEYLSYAKKNRHEWELRGQAIVAEMVATLNNMHAK